MHDEICNFLMCGAVLEVVAGKTQYAWSATAGHASHYWDKELFPGMQIFLECEKVERSRLIEAYLFTQLNFNRDAMRKL